MTLSLGIIMLDVFVIVALLVLMRQHAHLRRALRDAQHETAGARTALHHSALAAAAIVKRADVRCDECYGPLDAGYVLQLDDGRLTLHCHPCALAQ